MKNTLSRTGVEAEQLLLRWLRSGCTAGTNTPGEQAAEARRLGGANEYQGPASQCVIGAVQTEALLADSLTISPEARHSAYEQRLDTAEAADDPTKRIHFLRWQSLRVAGPLGEMPRRRRLGRSQLPPQACNSYSAS
ncbi:MAG TPA: DUF6245 family protein [Chloroflexota bacterium]|jgi:hypothetical protein